MGGSYSFVVLSVSSVSRHIFSCSILLAERSTRIAVARESVAMQDDHSSLSPGPHADHGLSDDEPLRLPAPKRKSKGGASGSKLPKKSSKSKPPKSSKSAKSSKSSKHSKGKGSKNSKSNKSSKALPGEKTGKISKSKSRSRLVVSIPINRAHASADTPPLPPSKSKSKSKSKSGAGHSSKKKNGKKGVDADADDGAASSGDEYATDLFNTYIGQIGACVALGLEAGDVLNPQAWDNLTEDERESLRANLPPGLSQEDQERAVRRVLDGESLNFGSSRDRLYEDIAAGLTHPRVRRWQQRVTLAERRHHLLTLKDYQNRFSRRVAAWKACKESSQDALAGLAALGGSVTKAGGPLLARPDLIHVTAEAAAKSSINDWDAERWARVLDFRNQETERYCHPERAHTFHNPWGTSIVSPLKRGPALDGGRPREHPMLRNERPSHVTILCIVRDAASRLRNNRGTRSDICDLLRDSQYLRDGATFQQLNSCVSGALDRLHYEENAPVRYDPESKEWCYLHNDMREHDFEVPAWAKANSARALANGGILSKSKKKKMFR